MLVGIAERIAATRAFDPARFVPFELDGAIAGHVRRDYVTHLGDFADVFAVGRRIAFQAHIRDRAQRSAAMERVARELAARGLLSTWRNETYAIAADAGGESSFDLERCAVRFFGFTARAVHVNGLTGGGHAMWIAQRSPHKAIDPGMFDNLVGGGIASGLTSVETLRKEAWEEAGIGPQLAGNAAAAGGLRIRREAADGLHAEIIEVFDLALPEAFVPVNQDGEVAGFRKLSLDALVRELEGEAVYTVDAAAVAIDCLARLGAIGAQSRLSNPG